MNEAYVLVQLPFTRIEQSEEDFIKIKFSTVNKLAVGDEYHTLEELYSMRMALTVALFKTYDTYITPLATSVKCWKSKKHDDGTMFEDYFICGMSIPQVEGPMKYISFHYKMEHWGKFHCIELGTAPPYDGYTTKDVIERLMKL